MFIFVSKLNVKFSILENVWSKPLNSQQLPNHPTSCDAVLCYRSKMLFIERKKLIMPFHLFKIFKHRN